MSVVSTPETSGATKEVTLFGHWTCPFVHRVAWALAQRGIEHDLVEVPPSAVRPAGFVLPQEFVDHSPRLEVPMVRVGDEYLADSIPVLEWLEERLPAAPPLLPDDPGRRAVVRERMAWVDANIFGPMIGIYYGTDPDRIAWASSELARALRRMVAWFGDDAWLAGPEPTLADAVFVPFHVRFEALCRLGFEAPVPPEVVSHRHAVEAGAGWPAVAWSDEQVDDFVGRFEAYRRKRRRP